MPAVGQFRQSLVYKQAGADQFINNKQKNYWFMDHHGSSNTFPDHTDTDIPFSDQNDTALSIWPNIKLILKTLIGLT